MMSSEDRKADLQCSLARLVKRLTLLARVFGQSLPTSAVTNGDGRRRAEAGRAAASEEPCQKGIEDMFLCNEFGHLLKLP
ncbi:Hypp4312 [Branchiostoma lanceolatum]|uniref:Hypp4312 protein n=1 Tax=Branchiostoma lanceolatum TaxID=7740 RepID=A0A8K0A758_BRALA|nr:Hypp4312 [Branchiostoma lanceolatum]